jgi:hypothetical protein
MTFDHKKFYSTGDTSGTAAQHVHYLYDVLGRQSAG